MQLEGMLLLLIMLIIIPILSIVSNDTAFFIILSLVLSFTSMKNILTHFFPVITEDDEETKELLEEIEENIDLDINKIKMGFNATKALVIILYFIYSSFFVDLFIYKVIISFIIVYWVHYVIDIIKTKPEHIKLESGNKVSLFEKYLGLLVNLLTLFIVVITNYTMFIK